MNPTNKEKTIRVTQGDGNLPPQSRAGQKSHPDLAGVGAWSWECTSKKRLVSQSCCSSESGRSLKRCRTGDATDHYEPESDLYQHVQAEAEREESSMLERYLGEKRKFHVPMEEWMLNGKLRREAISSSDNG
ncbi:hypothetical protein FDECE_15607 [Fusarium decemcellulare]|nr:hypothetical protein FDECE_15607 [Fusarium decemcellulare]